MCSASARECSIYIYTYIRGVLQLPATTSAAVVVLIVVIVVVTRWCDLSR